MGKKILSTLMGLAFVGSAQATDITERLLVPEGFSIEPYALNVDNARQLALSDSGIVYAGSRKAGKVHALIDADKDGQAERQVLIAEGLNLPSGIAFKDGDLYVAEVERIVRFKDIDSKLDKAEMEVVFDQLPDKRHHGWKFIRFSPQGDLIIPVGVPCNVCAEDPEFGLLYSLDLKSKEVTTIAKGVRNSVGFDYHPQTGNLWFSDNGRDMMGDDIPPCEINVITEPGQHFGFPYFHGGTIADPEFGKGKNMSDYVQPALNLGAHVAPLGIHFYTGEQFPAKFKNQLFVAEHGSWNRSKKAGYRVMVAKVEGDKVTGYTPFITGFMENEQTYGRPVAMVQMPDGSLLVSDDYANAIYRVQYNKK
ncbi:PQQ-dependent sugar dehydrogenase [Pseudoalteromonas sp. BDTF-M6]|uniref:PQQ-dependent sugar dehydrogenase n=1 Tax=Pseudoalteromonas sp. BDTF-M6 TaxID=2796132 RepID=UPI001BAE9487|nr:PQQ-dependent sugar dehydrogenase [Pseudoalteromonas sp. BDTF-M6]MBS3798223.1 PQQ-dependent sugar dehydrogenase [Pseudoalteromonas sp. BDTF-M6]